MSEYILLLVGTVLVNNFVLVKFLGLCPFMGVSRKLETATGMGLATTFVLTLSSVCSYLVNEYVLAPLDLEYLRTIAFILVIAAVVMGVATLLQRVHRNLQTGPLVRVEPTGVFFSALGGPTGRLVPFDAIVELQVWRPDTLHRARQLNKVQRNIVDTGIPALVMHLREEASLSIRGGVWTRLVYRLSDWYVRRGTVGDEDSRHLRRVVSRLVRDGLRDPARDPPRLGGDSRLLRHLRLPRCRRVDSPLEGAPPHRCP